MTTRYKHSARRILPGCPGLLQSVGSIIGGLARQSVGMAGGLVDRHCQGLTLYKELRDHSLPRKPALQPAPQICLL
jgi:hypothetical protein